MYTEPRQTSRRKIWSLIFLTTTIYTIFQTILPQHTVSLLIKEWRAVDTPFSQHPPNPRRHSFSALYQNHPKRCNVGDTLRALIKDEEGNEINPADVGAEIQWFADGVEITDATDAEYTVIVGDEGVVLSVEVTIGDETYTAETEEVEAAEEPVEELTVSIDNPSPKVGDILTVTAEDADGKDVDLTDADIQWFMGDKELEGETDDTLDVTLDMLGEMISVIVTIDDVEYKASAKEEVGVREDLEIEGLQTGANEIIVTSNNQIKTTDTISLTQGGIAVANTPAISDDGKTITLVTAAKLKDAEYTVKITTALEEEAECTVVCEAAKLESVKFGETLALVSNTNFYVAQCLVTGADQFGDDFDLGSNLTVYPSIATATDKELADNKDRNKINDEIYTTGYDSKTKTYTVVKGGSIPFQVGDTVTMTGIYQNGTTTVQGQEILTVSNAAYISELEFADFDETCTQNASLVGKRVTVDNFRKGTYYLKVLSAEDQYGNTVTAQTLNNAIEAQTLFINPVAADGAYGGVGDANDKDDKKYFDTLDDGTIILKLDAKKDSIPGEGMITIAGLGGLSVTPSFYVDYNPYIAELNVTVPALVAGKAAELTVTATDNYDDPVDLYEYFEDKGFWADRAKDEDLNAKAPADKIELGDENGLTKSTSSLAISAKEDADLYYQVSYSKKTVKFFYYHDISEKATTDVLTISTASPKVTTQTLTIAKTPKIAGLAKGLSKTTSNKGYIRNGGSYVDANNDGTCEGNAFDFTGKIYVIDEDGDYVSTVEAAASQVPGQLSYEDSKIKYTPLVGGKRGNATVLEHQPAADTYYYVLETSDKTLGGMSTDPLGKTDEAGNEIDNSTGVNATLYFWDDDNDKLVKLDTADYKVRTVELNEKGMYESYEGKVGGGLFYNTLWDVYQDEAPVTVTGYDAENDFVTLDVNAEYTISVDQGLRVFGSTIEADPSVDLYLPNKVLSEGTATVRIFDTVKQKEQDIQTFNYSNATPVATGRYGIADEDLDVDPNTTYSITNGLLTINPAGKTLSISDQYGLPMADTMFTIGGTQIKAPTYVDMIRGGNLIYANSGNVEQILNVGYEADEDDVEVQFPVIANNVSTATALERALNAAAASGSADVITIAEGADIVLPKNLEVAEDDTLVIPYGSKVTVLDAYIDGTVRGSLPFLDNNRLSAGTLKVTGTLNGPETGYAMIDLPSDSLVLSDATVYGNILLTGHIKVSGGVTIDADADVRIIEKSVLDFEPNGSLSTQAPIKVVDKNNKETLDSSINIAVGGELTSDDDAESILASITTDIDAVVSVDSDGKVQEPQVDENKVAAREVDTLYADVADYEGESDADIKVALDAMTITELENLQADVDKVQKAYGDLTDEQKLLVNDYDAEYLADLGKLIDSTLTEKAKTAKRYNVTYTGATENPHYKDLELPGEYVDDSGALTDEQLENEVVKAVNAALDKYFVAVTGDDVTKEGSEVSVKITANVVYTVKYTVDGETPVTLGEEADDIEVIKAPNTKDADIIADVANAVNRVLDTEVYDEVKTENIKLSGTVATVTLNPKDGTKTDALKKLASTIKNLEDALDSYDAAGTTEEKDAALEQVATTLEDVKKDTEAAKAVGATDDEIQALDAKNVVNEAEVLVSTENTKAAQDAAESALEALRTTIGDKDAYWTMTERKQGNIVEKISGEKGLIAQAEKAVDEYGKLFEESARETEIKKLKDYAALAEAKDIVKAEEDAAKVATDHATALAFKAGETEWTAANKEAVTKAKAAYTALNDNAKKTATAKKINDTLGALEADIDADTAANTFRTKHETILAKTADDNTKTGLKGGDETNLKAAEDDYKTIVDENVKAKLKTEAKKLEDLRKYMKEVVNKPEAPTLSADSIEAGTTTGTIKFKVVSAENEYALAATNTAPTGEWKTVDDKDISDAVGKYLFVRVAETESAVASDASKGLLITKDKVKAPAAPNAVTGEDLKLGSAIGTFGFAQGYGESLQYALANSETAPVDESAWKDVTTVDITKGDNTHIFVRVKATDKLPASAASDAFEIPANKVLTKNTIDVTEATYGADGTGSTADLNGGTEAEISSLPTGNKIKITATATDGDVTYAWAKTGDEDWDGGTDATSAAITAPGTYTCTISCAAHAQYAAAEDVVLTFNVTVE